MKAAAKKACSVEKETPTGVEPADVYTRVHALLVTLRSIAEREDELCSLLHHMRGKSKLSGRMVAELHTILDEIPSAEYLEDLRGLRHSLELLEGGPGGQEKAKRRAA